jgi:hypothetical protein
MTSGTVNNLMLSLMLTPALMNFMFRMIPCWSGDMTPKGGFAGPHESAIRPRDLPMDLRRSPIIVLLFVDYFEIRNVARPSVGFGPDTPSRPSGILA